MFHVEQRLSFRIICRKKRDRQFRLEKPVSFLLLDQTRAENPAGQMFGVRSQMNVSAVSTRAGVMTRSTDHSKSISVIPNFFCSYADRAFRTISCIPSGNNHNAFF